MKYLIPPNKYVNIKHRKDSGYSKMETYLGTRLLAVTFCLRISNYRTFSMEHQIIFHILCFDYEY